MMPASEVWTLTIRLGSRLLCLSSYVYVSPTSRRKRELPEVLSSRLIGFFCGSRSCLVLTSCENRLAACQV